MVDGDEVEDDRVVDGEDETSEVRMPYEHVCLLRGGAGWMSRLGRLCRNVAVVKLRD